MITFNCRGLLSQVGELREGTSQNGKDWKFITFLMEVRDGRFVDRISLQASGENADIINDCSDGEEIAVEGYIYAREYKDRWYNTLEVNKIYRSNRTSAAAPAHSSNAGTTEDDLPF